MKYSKQEKNVKPPVPWCWDMRDRDAHCPVCAEPGMVRISKAGRPFYSCRSCHSKLFMNSERAASRFKAVDKFFTTYLKAYRQHLIMQYRRTIELDADGSRNDVGLQRAREGSAAEEKIAKASSAAHAEILRAGRSCILCGGPAEFRKARKGEYQNCIFAEHPVTHLFLDNHKAGCNRCTAWVTSEYCGSGTPLRGRLNHRIESIPIPNARAEINKYSKGNVRPQDLNAGLPTGGQGTAFDPIGSFRYCSFGHAE